jgi:superoxide dismutase, Fe-Mn family
LALELSSGALRTIGMANHAQALAACVPLLVLDMYEHSYHIDFGAAAARYVDAFFANIHWEDVNKRFDRATRAAALLRNG